MRFLKMLRNRKKLKGYIFVALLAISMPHVGHTQAWFEHIQTRCSTVSVEQAWAGRIAAKVPAVATIHNLDAWESLIIRRV